MMPEAEKAYLIRRLKELIAASIKGKAGMIAISRTMAEHLLAALEERAQP